MVTIPPGWTPGTDTDEAPRPAATLLRAAKAQRELEHAELLADVLGRRLEGHEFAHIATALGLSGKSQAHKLWRQALRELPRMGAKRCRVELIAKIGRLERLLWPSTRRDSSRIAAVAQILDLMRFRAKLEGAEAPRRTELSGPRGGPIETADGPNFVIVLPPEEPLPSIEAR